MRREEDDVILYCKTFLLSRFLLKDKCSSPYQKHVFFSGFARNKEWVLQVDFLIQHSSL